MVHIGMGRGGEGGGLWTRAEGLVGGIFCLCPAGASTPPMTIHTASVTPSNTLPTHCVPRSSRLGEEAEVMWVELGDSLFVSSVYIYEWGCGYHSVC